MQRITNPTLRSVLLPGTNVILTTGLDWRNFKIEYNNWRRLWRERFNLMPEEWKDFDTFREALPQRPRDAFFLALLEQTSPLTSASLEWRE